MKGERLSANNVHPPFIYKKGQRSLYYHLTTDDSLLTLVCISQEIEKLSSCRIGFTCQWCNNHARWPIVMARESSPPWPFIAKQTGRGRAASATFHDHIFIFLRYFFCSAWMIYIILINNFVPSMISTSRTIQIFHNNNFLILFLSSIPIWNIFVRNSASLIRRQCFSSHPLQNWLSSSHSRKIDNLQSTVKF